MRPRVHAEKHIVQRSLGAIAAGAIDNFDFAIGVSLPTAGNSVHVREGSTISAVYFEMWISGDDATQSSAIITVEKLSGSSTAMTTTESAALNAYDNKRNVLHTQMGLIPPDIQYPMASVKGWIKIPRGKQRMSLGDRLTLNIHGQSNGVSFCGFILYKEQF